MKNIVITGSTRGIGFSMATEFLRAGCNVTLSGRGEELAKAAYTQLSPFICVTHNKKQGTLQCDFVGCLATY